MLCPLSLFAIHHRQVKDNPSLTEVNAPELARAGNLELGVEVR